MPSGTTYRIIKKKLLILAVCSFICKVATAKRQHAYGLESSCHLLPVYPLKGTGIS